MTVATSWRLPSQALDLSRGVLMGVINATPDSFSDGGRLLDPGVAVDAGLSMVKEGAEIIDIGGESTRPGAGSVTASEEIGRVLPIVEGLVRSGVTVSIDTSKPEVAAAAVSAGAQIVNDVTGVVDPAMIDLVAESGVGVIAMHMKGTPRSMQADPHYDDVVGEVRSYLSGRLDDLIAYGVLRESIAIDPGIGFGKTLQHNLSLINRLEELAGLGAPLVLGASRKSFLGTLTGIDKPADRDGATAVTTAVGFERGARVFRVHEVVDSRVALSVAGAIVADEQWDEWLQDLNHGDSPG